MTPSFTQTGCLFLVFFLDVSGDLLDFPNSLSGGETYCWEGNPPKSEDELSSFFGAETFAIGKDTVMSQNC